MGKELINKTTTLIIGSFSLLAALAWNDTIKEFIKNYISPGSDLISMFIYAILITIVAVVVSVYLTKLADKIIKREEKLVKDIEKLKDELVAKK
jgi:uncharacterized membrane protein (DUF106 family)